MKLIALTIAFFGITLLLALTNPKLEAYEQFVNQQMQTEARKQEDTLVNVMGSLFGGLATDFVIKQTVRKDWVFFSTYDSQFGKEHLKVVGLFNNFYITDKPSFLKENTQ
jgi:Domain of unknown function (DUF4359)